MDPSLLFSYIRELLKQTYRNFHWFLLGAGAVAFAILGAGMMYETKFETSATIYADTKNVIKPLLAGQATVTVPKSERIRIVQEIMYSPRLLEQVIRASFPDIKFIPGSGDMEQTMLILRKQIKVSAPATDYIKVTYRHTQPEVSYRMVNKLISLFIQQSAQNMRSESKSAYTFIDQQVSTYKGQLVKAENNLKAFDAANIDGGSAQVNAAIDRIRNQIEDLAIDIEAEEVRIAVLEVELADESRYATSDFKARVHRSRLAQLESQLDTLRLNFRDQHPDIVDLQLQIQDVKRTIVEVENSRQTRNSQTEQASNESSLNPIYEQLSGQLSTSMVDLQTMKHRLSAYENRLDERYERRGRIAANQAEVSELTRDYSVTKGIYEDLLARKERARISMTLDLSGQGVSYKVLEPAVFPRLPSGFRFLYFVLAGPVFGVAVAIGVIGALILLDPRIKFSARCRASMSRHNASCASWRSVTSMPTLQPAQPDSGASPERLDHEMIRVRPSRQTIVRSRSP